MPKPKRALAPLVAVALAAVLVLVATACGGSDEKKVADAGAKTVTIDNFMFVPSTLEVPAGTRITVRNTDDTAHTLTADDGSFKTGVIDGGRTKTVVVEGSGDVAYRCSIHEYMTGVIRIVGS